MTFTSREPIGRGVLANALMLVALLAISAAASFEPVFKPTATIARTERSIHVDGDITPAEWNAAATLTKFHERFPGDMTEPEVSTRVYTAYDQDKLYVAFVCLDDPASVRATMTQRDQFSGDDAVAVLLDTYGAASWAYQFFVNPYGIQRDVMWSTTGMNVEDPSFDVIWQSAARITDSGYQVEMAIPFASLRFPNKDQQNWKIDFWRNRPREVFKQYSWAAYDRNEQCFPCQWGSVDGISNVQPGRGVELLPTYIATQAGNLPGYDPNNSFDNRGVKGEWSFGGKYALSSSVVAEGAWNPDFSQIESDVAQVDVNTTIALFYPERRPFFQEGADIFRTLFNSFYTRTVNDPQFASKLTGRKDAYTFGLLTAVDEVTPYIIPLNESSVYTSLGKSYVNVARGMRSFGEDTRLGVMFGDRRFEGGGSGTVAAFDGDVRLSQKLSIDGQYIFTHTAEPNKPLRRVNAVDTMFADGRYTVNLNGESFTGWAFITRFLRQGRSWYSQLGYNQIDPTYRTQVGFDPIANHRTVDYYTQYIFYVRKGWIDRIVPQAYALRRWDMDGKRKLAYHTLSLDLQTTLAQTGITLSARNNTEYFMDGLRQEGLLHDNLWRGQIETSSRPIAKFGWYLNGSMGRDYSRIFNTEADEVTFFASLNLKPIDRLTIDPSINYVRGRQRDSYRFSNIAIDDGDELYRQTIARCRVQFQVNRKLSVRLVTQYQKARQLLPAYDPLNDWLYADRYESEQLEFDPLITYRLNSFSVFYAGSSHDVDHLTYAPNPADPGRLDETWRQTSRQFFAKLQYLFQI